MRFSRTVGKLTQHSGFLSFHPLEHRLRLLTIDICLPQHRKTDPVVQLTELLDLIIATRILAVELIAREAQYDELIRVLLRERLVQLF